MNGIELYLDVANGDVLRQESSSLSDLARDPLPPVSAEEGVIAAEAAQSGGQAIAFDLDREDGILVWYVEVRGPSGFNAVYVDANSGQVLFTEPAD